MAPRRRVFTRCSLGLSGFFRGNFFLDFIWPEKYDFNTYKGIFLGEKHSHTFFFIKCRFLSNPPNVYKQVSIGSQNIKGFLIFEKKKKKKKLSLSILKPNLARFSGGSSCQNSNYFRAICYELTVNYLPYHLQCPYKWLYLCIQLLDLQLHHSLTNWHLEPPFPFYLPSFPKHNTKEDPNRHWVVCQGQLRTGGFGTQQRFSGTLSN